MRLTQKQEALITRYLRDVLALLDEKLPDAARERGMTRLQARIKHELLGLAKDPIADADVQAMLNRLGDPARQAAAINPQRPTTETLTPAKDDRIWLGVCGGIADYLDVSPRVVRGLALLLGVSTGPLSIFVYLVVYTWLYWAAAPGEAPRIRKALVLWRALSTFLIALALHAGSTYSVRLIYFAHTQYLKRAIPELGDWGWLQVRAGELFFWSVAICVPLAVLSALPLANAWDYSLKRIVQALLALYGIVLSFGIASILVGLILDFVKEVTG